MSDETGPGGFAGRLGVVVEQADDGTARLAFEATDEHLNPAGTVHGGVLATLVDTAMGTAVRSTTGDEDVPATSQLTVTYLRPGKPGRLGGHRPRAHPRASTSRSARPTSSRTVAAWCTPSRPSPSCTTDHGHPFEGRAPRHPAGRCAAWGPPGVAQLSSVSATSLSTRRHPVATTLDAALKHTRLPLPGRPVDPRGAAEGSPRPGPTPRRPSSARSAAPDDAAEHRHLGPLPRLPHGAVAGDVPAALVSPEWAAAPRLGGHDHRELERRRRSPSPTTSSPSRATPTSRARRCARTCCARRTHHTFCPWKGTASYYHLEVDGQVNRDAVWYYPSPRTPRRRSPAASPSGTGSRSAERRPGRPGFSVRGGCRPAHGRRPLRRRPAAVRRTR